MTAPKAMRVKVVMGHFDIGEANCPPESGGQRDREADPARGGSKATSLKMAATEPPPARSRLRLDHAALLTQEGSLHSP